MATLSYCYKLSTLLGNYHNCKVITGGGVYRNKKLQMGSVVPLIKNNVGGNSNKNQKNLGEYMNIHLVAELAKTNFNFNFNQN